jgi:D-3-phosphoglycerate dehydrogenase
MSNKSKSLAKDKIKILLLEGPHQTATDVFNENGYYNIEYHKGSLSGDELKAPTSTSSVSAPAPT